MGSSPIGHPKLPPPRKWRPPRLPRRPTAGVLFAAIQETALAQVEANRAGVLRSGDPEYLHQLRVGLRRLRSALRAFRDLLSRRRSARLARRVRGAMRKLGEARDWDVFTGWLESEAAPREVLARASALRAAARAQARRAVSGLALEPIKPKTLDAELGAFAAAVLEKLERKARRQARADLDDPAERHKLRIRVKRLRYASEFFGRRQPQLERLQEVLGELNDVEVARRLLRQLRAREPRIDQALDARERRLLGGLDRMKTSAWGQASGRRG